MDGLIIGVVLIVIAFFVNFLIEKKPWRGYESFADWQAQMVKKLKGLGDWGYKQLQNLKKRGWQIILVLWAIRLRIIYIVFAAIVLYHLLEIFFNLRDQLFLDIAKLEESELRNLAIAFLGTISGIGALFGVYLAILRSEENKRQNDVAQQQADIAEQGLITDRLNKATESLGKKDGEAPVLEVRLGSLYALERIAQDSIRDHIQVMEILCAYIRTNTLKSDEPDDDKPMREDIQTALTIIGRRETWPNGKKRIKEEIARRYKIDLRNCNLRGVQLTKANFSNANISSANLSKAIIGDTNFCGAMLNKINLNGTIFAETDMSNSWLNEADMTNVWFLTTKLAGARLNHANMSGAMFYEADMTDAITTETFALNGIFSGCLNLSQLQLNEMFLETRIKLPEGLTHPQHGTDYEEPCNDLEDFMANYTEWKDNRKRSLD